MKITKPEQFKTITSTQNPEIKEVAKLHEHKERTAKKQYLAEGVRIVSTIIQAGVQPVQLYVTSPLLKTALEMCDTKNICVVSDTVIKKLSSAKTPSGIVGVFPIPAAPDPALLSAGIILADITDPGNMGTLIRTCAALGKRSIVVIGGTDPWNPKVIQASAGTIAMVNVFCWSWREVVRNKRDLKVYALVVQDGQDPRAHAMNNGLIVVGNEARGIDEQELAHCDVRITLPMPGGVESLNAAVAGSIALYLGWFLQS